MLVPNPGKFDSLNLINDCYLNINIAGNRVEDFIFEKIEKKKPQRLSNIEHLGLDMIEAGAFVFK